ncbi:C2H2-type zinc finger transcription factor [Rhizophagus irregularis DAOM 181602=DAOM 197198]|nr:C2H2-type zinc finger transcription factor [Rhizophagus irregularis DAOM 181602=DAOM 197198]
MNHDSINLVEVLLHVIIFYIVCASVSDIDRRRYGWDNLFEKSSVLKEYGCENLVGGDNYAQPHFVLTMCLPYVTCKLYVRFMSSKNHYTKRFNMSASTTEPKKIHEYFERKTSEWNIIGFLNECNIETFRRKIYCYLKSLENIANTEEGRRRNKAQQLIKNYNQGQDEDLAKEWKNEHEADNEPANEPTNELSIYVHQPKFIGCANNGGNIYGEISVAENIENSSIVMTNKRNQEENLDDEGDRSCKRKRKQGNEDETEQPRTPKNKHEQDLESSNDSYFSSDDEIQDNRYVSPTYSLEDPFTEDTEDENVVITNIPQNFSLSKSSESDLFVNGVNISEKFRTYINESILHANNKGLYVETHSHEILSLSSILVLIPNSYSTKMVESFGLDVLESIYREYTPKLSIQLDIEIENMYRSVVKTCLNDSRNNAIKLLCAKIVQKNELMNNFCFLILDLIRNLPYDKIRNEPSELTLITNYLDNIMKNAFHIPDRHVVRWPNTALTESKVRKFDGSRAKQPDFVVSVNYQSRASNVIYVGEVTGPSEQGNVYKNCLDLVRIGIFMKDCMDSAVSQGAEIKILGFQCIAYRIDFYMLDLRDEIYILLNLRAILLESCDTFIEKLKNPGLAPLELKSSFRKQTLDTPEFRRLVSKTHCVKRECPLWFGRY